MKYANSPTTTLPLRYLEKIQTALTYGKSIPNCPNNSKEENRPEIIKEQSVRHEVPRIQNNRRKHKLEESLRGEGRHVDTLRVKQEQSNYKSDYNE